MGFAKSAKLRSMVIEIDCPTELDIHGLDIPRLLSDFTTSFTSNDDKFTITTRGNLNIEFTKVKITDVEKVIEVLDDEKKYSWKVTHVSSSG